MTKLSTVISDPQNGGTNPKAIPGAIVEYTLLITNAGGAIDNNTVVVTDAIPANTALFANNIGGVGSGPVSFQQGIQSSALSYTFTSLASATDDVSFSNNGGATLHFTPVPAANGCDTNVTHIRVNPKGTFASGTAVVTDPGFQLQFRVCIR